MPSTVTGECLLVDRFPFGDSEKAPAVEESILKNHIQLTHTLDDDIVLGVGGYLPSATEDVENMGSVSLIRQKRVQTIGDDLLGCLSGNSVYLGRGPLLSVDAVKYLDVDGVEQTLPTSNYRPSTMSSSIYFYGAMPVLAEGPDTIWVEYQAGYGDSAAAVPAAWQNIIMTLAMRKYDFRGGDSGATNDSWSRLIRRMVIAAGANIRA